MRTSLRLPDEMAEKIRERAASERRSMHAMILLLLEESLSERGPGGTGVAQAGRAPEQDREVAGSNPVRRAVPGAQPRSESDCKPDFKPDFKK